QDRFIEAIQGGCFGSHAWLRMRYRNSKLQRCEDRRYYRSLCHRKSDSRRRGIGAGRERVTSFGKSCTLSFLLRLRPIALALRALSQKERMNPDLFTASNFNDCHRAAHAGYSHSPRSFLEG